MARAGINKAVVSAARQAVIARGDNPTIDAVRIEMGNTGSKTTIHRYLKELEARAATQAVVAPSLSEELTHLVSHLADRLREEGATQVAEARAVFDEALAAAAQDLEQTRQRLAQLEQAHGIQTAALQAEAAERVACSAALQTEQTRGARLNQACDDLQTRLKDKDEHIASLEEKHRHARDALEHYRQSVKEQREQELRRHESQLQQLQGEVRQLQQSLQVRQQEATVLNRDNERLLAENRQAITQGQERQQEIAEQTRQLSAAAQSLAKVEGGRDELWRQLGEVRARLDEALAREYQHRRSIDQLETALAELHAREAAQRPAAEPLMEKGPAEEG
ncbi:DNA-binding protein [Pseudomonas sp. dw_358]|uniref:DNA-binding protein n=1 Tax=Pseudomonas sp. dw_358 TaxID=2720083 RepID=UPI001BD46702|nr:DNA-binding protein [Pseudomonas sp. dw_358]